MVDSRFMNRLSGVNANGQMTLSMSQLVPGKLLVLGHSDEPSIVMLLASDDSVRYEKRWWTMRVTDRAKMHSVAELDIRLHGRVVTGPGELP